MEMIINFLLDLRGYFIGRIPLKRLIKRGLVVGENCSINRSCCLDPSHCWHIKIGNNVTIGAVNILAHDASTKKHLGYAKIQNVFIGANNIILPGVKIGENSIVGAGIVVTKSVAANTVVGGNPANYICELSQYLDKHKKISFYFLNLFSMSHIR